MQKHGDGPDTYSSKSDKMAAADQTSTSTRFTGPGCPDQEIGLLKQALPPPKRTPPRWKSTDQELEDSSHKELGVGAVAQAWRPPHRGSEVRSRSGRSPALVLLIFSLLTLWQKNSRKSHQRYQSRRLPPRRFCQPVHTFSRPGVTECHVRICCGPRANSATSSTRPRRRESQDDRPGMPAQSELTNSVA